MSNMLHSTEHVWVLLLSKKRAKIGISNYAQNLLGDIFCVETTKVGERIFVNQLMGTIESIKKISEIYSPVSGEVVNINKQLQKTPEMINVSPYEFGWIIEIELTNPEELGLLLNKEEYEVFVNENNADFTSPFPLIIKGAFNSMVN